MKTTIALLALMSLALANSVQAAGTPPPKVVQTGAKKATNAQSNAQTTTQSNGNAQKAQGDLQCKTKTGKPTHCN